MRISIGLLTGSDVLRTFVTKNRNNVVPKEVSDRGYFQRHGASFSVNILPLEAGMNASDVDDWLKRLGRRSEGLILLIDRDARSRFSQFEDAYFLSDIPIHHNGVIQNFVHKLMAQTLRQFEALSRQFDQLGYRKMLLLPLDVFVAVELDEIRRRLTVNKMLPSLAPELQGLLAKVRRQRERPKSRGRNGRRYLVDDRSFWYRYGEEHHKQVETGLPPHKMSCWHNSQFRFGRKYDDWRHFNVDNDSSPTKVSGTFPDCHGSQISVKNESHLGVFPNGFQ